ncbi:MAG: NAD-dependent epimerase/dehydratase family protein [Synergistaceae bacterium]|nr:NAD-dependent epimerase/dehydratase family protein [Synergistaceae bacterium]
MKVLIFGGTGAMGSYLAEVLASRGTDAYVTTRQEYSDRDGIKYIRGNAHDIGFVKSVLDGGKYDAVIDFMNYSPADDFPVRAEILTGGTGHYFFLSSSRVYADSGTPIRETSPRLLDVSPDKAYLLTNEYAIKKAREEDVLRKCMRKNWTIIRPYITYSNERLQLGVEEKEGWLYRVIHGRPVVFSEDIAEHTTTLTWGHDVAEGIAGLLCRAEAFGQTYHITGDDAMKWRDIAEIYREVFADVTGREMRIVYVPKALYDTAQVKYDRLYDRVFDNSKIKSIVPEFRPVSIREGLTRCLTEFIRDNHPFRGISSRNEALKDRITGTHAKLSEFSGMNRVKYFVYRHCPALGILLRLGGKILRRIQKHDTH